jgi:subtilisin-like proprotein convertase family protein
MRRFKYLALAAAAAFAMPSLAADFSANEAGPYAVPGSGTLGPASTFPITFTVTGQGSVTDVNLQLTGLSHNWASDIGIALQKVGGPAILLMTDAGSWADFDNANIKFDQDAASALSVFYGFNPGYNIASSDYKPSTYGFNPLAWLLTSGNDLDLFNGLDANGTWNLWIWDDGFGTKGTLASATLQIESDLVTPPAVPEPATWAMMLGGMMIVGSAMRRRKTAVSFA